MTSFITFKPPDIRVNKSMWMRWTGHAARVGETGKKHTLFWLENLKGNDHSENQSIDGKIILEWILCK